MNQEGDLWGNSPDAIAYHPLPDDYVRLDHPVSANAWGASEPPESIVDDCCDMEKAELLFSASGDKFR